MFSYFTVIKAVYFYHQFTGNYLGINKPKNFSYDMVVLVKEPFNALDLKIVERKDSKNSKYKYRGNPEYSGSLSILNPKNNKRFTLYSDEGKNGSLLILDDKKDDKSQEFGLMLQFDGSLILRNQGKCVKYDDLDKNFRLGPCTNLDNSRFYLQMQSNKNMQKSIQFIKSDNSKTE